VKLRILYAIAFLGLLSAPAGASGAPVYLISGASADREWNFSNGQEFPGASGDLKVDPSQPHNGQSSLELTGDFSKGGVYVSTGTHFAPVDIRNLSMWLRSPDTDHITIQINDSSGQCHQISFKIQQDDAWQKFDFPLQKFFAKVEDPGGTAVSKYESWGGPADQKWHGPATSINIEVFPTDTNKIVHLWLSDVEIEPVDLASAGSSISVVRAVPLMQIFQGQSDWGFDNGEEFPGAKGALTVVQDEPTPGDSYMHLTADFTGGGGYVQALKGDLSDLGGDLQAIRLKIKGDNVSQFTLRLVDSGGQCFQHAGNAVVSDGAWHNLELKTVDMVGGEHWGGANDGKWHGPAKAVAILIGKDSTKQVQTSSLDLADLTAEVITPAVLGTPAFHEDFEDGKTVPSGWLSSGDISVDIGQAFHGVKSLLLRRSPDELDKPCSVQSPTFKVMPGTWRFDVACKSQLSSPDTSFDGVVTVEYLAGASVVGHATIADIFGVHNWQEYSTQLTPPPGADSARIKIQVNKATGKFWVDDIQATFASPTLPNDNRIVKLYFDSAQMSNLLFPTDSRKFTATLEVTRPLDPKQQRLTYYVSDYWGSEQTAVATTPLTALTSRIDNHIAYTGSFDLSNAKLDIGRYYEIHAQVPELSGDPYTNFTTFAILPEAPANAYKALDIPFSSRDWDDRIDEYVTLSHRLGIRLCCIWSGWDVDHPDQVYAPQIEHAAKLGMGVIAGTDLNTIETHGGGYQKLTEENIREGTRNLIAKYSKVAQPFILDLGNEPPVSADRILDDVKAYSYVYDETKKSDPLLMVLGTSVGPAEPFFAAGFGKYCDAYDFHVYEDSHNVALALQKYKTLFKTYGNPKPVWSTEMGLNSEGVSRHAVAIDMVKKVAMFLANGGTNLGWFDLLYPDPDGVNYGSSGSAHDIFDSRYNKYVPKLTAIVYYNLINSILDKKFVAEKDYGDTHLFLFRDQKNHSLIIEWKDKGREDVYLPFPGVGSVEATRIDTMRSSLDALGRGITITFDEDPLLLTFDGKTPLPAGFGQPLASFAGAPSEFVRGSKNTVSVGLSGIKPEDVSLIAPPFWHIAKLTTSSGVRGTLDFTVSSPAETGVKEADLSARLTGPSGKLIGELYLRPSVTGQLSSDLIPVPASGERATGVKLVVKNNGTKSEAVNWEMSLDGEMALANGVYPEKPTSTSTYFTGTPNGSITLAGGATGSVMLPIKGVDPQYVYQVSSTVTDSAGRSSTHIRNVAGFISVPKVTGKLTLDGKLTEADWKNAPVETIDQARQYFTFDASKAQWKGPTDLSGKIRFLWDDKYLYVGADVTDDIAGGLQEDSMLWAMDGLQFLVDPCRGLDESVGKYDYQMAVGKKGPEAWCSLSADAGAPNGEAKDIIVAYKRKGDGTGAITYEVAIPWTRLAPFKPRFDADLGLSMILNEDDGKGRYSYMTWFGNANTKEIATVGDLILAK